MEIAVSTYRHRHHHVSIPDVEIEMLEQETGNTWYVRAKEDIAYFVRSGNLLAYDHGGEHFESDLMKRRLECSLLMAANQFVELQPEGFVMFTDLTTQPFGTIYGLATAEAEPNDAVGEWFGAFTQYSWLRRAAEDVYNAYLLPSENMVFLFRAFEWLQKGLATNWTDLGEKIDLPQINLTRLKKDANSWESAARHANMTGVKGRFGEDIVGGWVQGTLHAITHARAAVDEQYRLWLEAGNEPFPIE